LKLEGTSTRLCKKCKQTDTSIRTTVWIFDEWGIQLFDDNRHHGDFNVAEL
jgi:hypothetical protein